MIITVATLKKLCSETLSPLNEYDTFKLQKVKQFIVDGLMHIPNEMHAHGHVYILESRENFRMRTNSSNAKLPKIPTRPKEEMGKTNYKKYSWKLKIYNKYMEVKRATVKLLQKKILDKLISLK